MNPHVSTHIRIIRICLWLALFILLGFAPAIVSAATLDDLAFTLINNDAEYSVSAKDNTLTGAVDIPATHNGKPVTQIGQNGFIRTAITSVNIPNSIKLIQDSAFNYCGSLTTVTFAENAQLTEIQGAAFSDCGELTSIDLPDSVTSLGGSLFALCRKLHTVDLPKGITSIPSYMFYYCRALTSIDLPESVSTIGTQAFQQAGLTEITLPASVTHLHDYALHFCEYLASVTFLGPAPTLGNGVFEDTGKNVGGFTLTIFDTHEDSYASWRDSYTFNVVPDPSTPILLYTAVSYNPTSKALSIITENEDSETSLSLQHKASLSADWATLSNLNYITSTETNTQRTTRTVTLDPEANPSGFYRLISAQSSQ